MTRSLGVIAFRTLEYQNSGRIHTVESGEAYSGRSPFVGKLWRPWNFWGFEWGKVEVMHRNSMNHEKTISALLA
jgi:hypothetical protein